ncbi:LysR substrate-binding domain-containing protein [Methylosinus sporium]|uniref:LysR family transcriptional regulator n=1 Tax=Methylosinus sporium TaxID=428 RepID=A0A2U1SNQ0_METSR|nr:LysR substrate-binding domain-containing protein [Methylosinus sporium]PWB93238.1 LysR family transcriptional regulator [Methylosinus sporium]
MRNLETAWLRTLVAVADCGSFAKAAQAVNRSESAVSLHVGNLERETGASLFRREGRRMVLTDEGLTLLDYARKALELHDGVLKQFARSPHDATVRIGLPRDFADTWLPAVLASLAQKHPRIHLQTIAARSPDLVRSLGRREIDIAMIYGETQEAPCLWSGSLSMVWIGAQDLSLSRFHPLPLAVFDPPCAFRGAAMDALERAGMPWTVAFASPTLASLWGAVGSGIGVTVRTPLGIPPRLRIMGREDGLPGLPSVELGLYAAVDIAASPAASAVADIMTGVVGQSLRAAI